MAKEENQESKNEDQGIQQKVDAVLSNEDLSERDKILLLHEMNFSRNQLVHQLGFTKTSVYRTLPASPEGEPGDKETSKNGEDSFRLPSTLKVGQGREMINPEAILNQYLLGDGDSGKWMLKGMMVLTDVEIMKGQAEAQSKAIQPILSLMEKSREDMDSAAQRAKESNQEIANRAAAGAAAQVMPSIDQLASQLAAQKIASSPNPMMSMFTDAMQPYLGQMIGNMMKAFQPKPGQPGPQPGQP